MGSAEETVKDTACVPEAEEFEFQVRYTVRGHGRPNSDTSKPKVELFDVASCPIRNKDIRDKTVTQSPLLE